MNYYAGPGFVLPIFGQAMIKMVQPFLGKMQLETFEFQLLADFLFERKSIAIYLLQTEFVFNYLNILFYYIFQFDEK